jgi:hypothetical protein
MIDGEYSFEVEHVHNFIHNMPNQVAYQCGNDRQNRRRLTVSDINSNVKNANLGVLCSQSGGGMRIIARGWLH